MVKSPLNKDRRELIMHQTEENIPKSKTFWKAQNWANIEFNLLNATQDLTSQEFYDFFDDYAKKLITLSPKEDQVIFLTQLLIHSLQNKNIRHGRNEIDWIKQQFEDLKVLSRPSLNVREDFNKFRQTYLNPSDFEVGAILYAIFHSALIKFYPITLVLGPIIVGTSSWMRSEKTQNPYTFWNLTKTELESPHPEIQTLFDYFNKEINQKEEEIKLKPCINLLA